MRHPGDLQRPPGVGLAEQGQGTGEGFEQRGRRVIPEAEPRHAVADRIGQTADLTHHRNRPVAHAVHLVETTRLEPRRHQKDVRAALDKMGELLVEPDPRPDARGMRDGKR